MYKFIFILTFLLFPVVSAPAAEAEADLETKHVIVAKKKLMAADEAEAKNTAASAEAKRIAAEIANTTKTDAVKTDTKTQIPYREDSGLTKTEYLISVGQYSAAIHTADDVLARHSQNADAYTYRGYAYYRLGDFAKAAGSYRKALILNPTHLGANKYLADMYLEAGDVSRALEQLQVIRMTCGNTDCAELNDLERSIDKFKQGSR
jgi:tetratricopeptide (TPR) repeat protein